MSNFPARTRIFADGEVLLRAGADHEVGFVIPSRHVRLYDEHDVAMETLDQMPLDEGVRAGERRRGP